MSKHDSFFSPTTAPLSTVFKRPTSHGPSLVRRDYPGPRSGKTRFSVYYPASAARAGLSDRPWCPYNYICLWTKKIFESYFRDRLTFSNIDNRTSRRIYRLALLMRAPETLSSLSKSRISIFNAQHTLLVRRMTSHNSIGKYRHLVNLLGICLGMERRRLQTRLLVECRTGKK